MSTILLAETSTLYRCHVVNTSCVLVCCRRVHITEDTLKWLGDEYQVEPGNGHLRSPFIQKRGVETFLIVPDNTSRVVSLHHHCCFLLIIKIRRGEISVCLC